MALLCGDGFTISYFIAGARGDDADTAALRAAILIGSALSAIAGGALLDWAQRERPVGSDD